MRTEKEKEQELKQLDLDLREMRHKEYKLGQEINHLNSEQIRTAKTIGENRQMIASLTEKIKTLNKEASEARAKCKQEEVRFAKVTKEIDEKLEEPQLLIVEVDGKQRKLLKDTAKLDQDKAEVRDGNKALAQEKAEVKRNIAELKRKIEETANSNAGLKKAIASYDQKAADLDLQKDNVASQLEKAKELNNTLATKIKKADDGDILLKEKVKANDRQTSFLESQKEQYEKRLIEVAYSQKEAEGTKTKFESAFNQLGQREKELRLKELKFQKLVRDKNMNKELEKLEAEAK